MSLQKILLQHEPRPENLLKVIKALQKENKSIEIKECGEVAKYFSLPLARVYSTASFFDEIAVKKSRKTVIKVCSGGPCLAEGSMEVVRQIEMLLHVEAENDGHPKYKLEFISCRGLCDQGPIVMVGKEVFERVAPEMVDDIIKNYI